MMWKTTFGVLLISLSVAIGACVTRDDRRPDSEAAQDSAEVAASALTTESGVEDFGNAGFRCDGSQPGLPIPLEREDEFGACFTGCMNGPFHPTSGVCWGTCCRQVTATPSLPGGCAQCFFQ